MAERTLTDTFETVGEWFLPEAPDRLVPGSLSCKSGHTELHLSDAFSPLAGRLTTVGAPPYPLVYGFTRDGEAITLVNAMRMGVSINFGAGGVRQRERMLSTQIVVGAHVPAGWMPTQINIRIPSLHIWLSRPSIQQSFENSEELGHIQCFRVCGVPTEAIKASTIAAEFNLWVRTTSNANPFGSISVTSAGWVGIRPDVPQPLDWYYEVISKLTTLISFLAGCPMPPDFIEVPIDDQHRTASIVVALQDRKLCEHQNIHEFFLPRGGMGISLDEAIPRWFDACQKVWASAQLAASILGSEHLWLHVEFLSLIQALEGFHRSLYDGQYMDEKKYEAVKGALTGAIPPDVGSDHKASLTSRIRYGNQISLAKRLDALSAGLDPQIRVLLFGDTGKYPRSWVDTRNYYTHWDDDLRKNILDTEEMYWANVRMRHFLRVLYLDLVGIPQTVILSALRGMSDGAQFLLQILERERVARDPNYVPAAYGSISTGVVAQDDGKGELGS